MVTTKLSTNDSGNELEENVPNHDNNRCISLQVKIMVGGAVLTEEYAMRIGADGYAKDGIGAVRCVESLYADLCKNWCIFA